jgi:hypothetical protein
MIAPWPAPARRRAMLQALALSVGILAGLLPPAPRAAPAYAQSPGPGEPAAGAAAPAEQTATDRAAQPPADQADLPADARQTPSDVLISTPTLGLPSPEALWYAQQWQQAQGLAMARQWQLQAQAMLAAWSQTVLAASLLARPVAAPLAPPPSAAPPALAPLPPPNDRARLQQVLAPDGDGLCGLAPGHVCQVGGDLAGSTVTPLGAFATAGSQWRLVVPAGRSVAGATATVFVPTTRGTEFFDCPPATASGPTVCTGQTRGHALQRGTARVHVGNAVVAQGAISGPGVAVQKLLIVVPGIDPTQSSVLYDPYERASNNFGSAVCSGFSPCTSLFQALGCPSQSGGPSTTLVPCGTSGLA